MFQIIISPTVVNFSNPKIGNEEFFQRIGEERGFLKALKRRVKLEQTYITI